MQFQQVVPARTKFTDIEDIKLLSIVRQMDKINWKSVSAMMGNRSARQCRERYNNYLSPTVQNKTWTPEEEELLLQSYDKYGPQWSLMTKFFKNRAAVNIKNHYAKLASNRQNKSKTNNEITETDYSEVSDSPIEFKDDQVQDFPLLEENYLPNDVFDFYTNLEDTNVLQALENWCEYC
ncbi:Myb-like DNA-binding domain containing protein [Tritrichomonas foetus]|uniref:Myb-like DNA-binding domain containing protein n=1 Tax=Tritrichomonas foetus TaxID=1144522 RepID=A0A1J4KLJ0_9EUKA|nr:Myb-like DNA-binding domain containing protein [Tritrichomonas foetus]|eukprot:OHT10558.1 Myb-like DNA-binding domain containing protein [Tritrichomonas foetus]